MTTKQELYDFCRAFVEDRIARIQNNIKGIQESLTSETKSSAGDKHETGRAMLQLEREKLGHQLAEAEKMKQTLAKVVLKSHLEVVQLGSLVKTSKADYFLAISTGEYKMKGQPVFCISIQTPIAQLLIGKSKQDIVMFNGSEITIIDIL
ncbi:3-oxoacyl-ACP synthase [Kriegella aquimaris]|uniref:3-oxoacyl-ACP synthase n=1 Tax=Kriegella aquimaris TaxID=192904 RepID=A0A1G9LHB3_9FLAO|nr:3-oxoacyl-ACP synthase [Kriegella aquimaris]SDL61359.1 hypothetical protein SAMN04488514_10268 [Kriegella aquimaris]